MMVKLLLETQILLPVQQPPVGQVEQHPYFLGNVDLVDHRRIDLWDLMMTARKQHQMWGLQKEEVDFEVTEADDGESQGEARPM